VAGSGEGGDVDCPELQTAFNILAVEIESKVEPDCVRDDVWRESVAFISVYPPILAIWAS